ncbi:MAG TPA: hypothetical protein ENK91_09925, partial [Bacteroidetes bacterium]|nr:hypothetical protein [Bacteroidota bacterium]
MKILLEANQLFKQKEFDKAYELYLKVADEYGLELVKYNLEKCKKQMSKQKVYPENEEESILNEYFDHIYVVNLKNQVHQRLKIALHLLQHNIKFQIFEATNGYKGEAFEKWQEYQKRPIGRFERFKHYSQEEIQHKKPFIESAGA